MSENVISKKLFPYFLCRVVRCALYDRASRDSRAMLVGGPGGSTNGVQSSVRYQGKRQL
ncbi:hypothetical protein KCP73_19675 [Salmonella enterica subsp. enterica]|nr:hypothetical protein KCP73_19675 [Salmonella enterica subsp. enterica]